jgi:hypothetical protein
MLKIISSSKRGFFRHLAGKIMMRAMDIYFSASLEKKAWYERAAAKDDVSKNWISPWWLACVPISR